MDPNAAAFHLITDLYSQVRLLMEQNQKLHEENQRLSEILKDKVEDKPASK